jgi:nanoRNase/pAp phosphatase (c-di-AMP/oligoRNAs hydrolase)
MLSTKKDDFLSYLKGKNLLITTHDSADLDGFVSVIVLKFFFDNFFLNQNIYLTFSKLSKYTQNFVVKFLQKFPDFNFPSENDENFSDIDIIVIVDTNNLEQIKLSSTLNLEVPFIFVDHHLDLKKNYGRNIIRVN